MPKKLAAALCIAGPNIYGERIMTVSAVFKELDEQAKLERRPRAASSSAWAKGSHVSWLLQNEARPPARCCTTVSAHQSGCN